MSNGDQTLQKMLKEKEEVLKDKEELIRRLVDRCDRQEKRLAALLGEQGENVKCMPFALYQPFLWEEQGSCICFRVTGESVAKGLPIWLSPNLQIVSYHPVTSLEKKVSVSQRAEMGVQCDDNAESSQDMGLSKDVDELKLNLSRCEQFIENLRELKEMDSIQREQQQHSPKQLSQCEQLRENIRNLQSELVKVSAANEKLRKRVGELQDMQGQYVIAMGKIEKGKLDGDGKQGVLKHKRVYLNF